MINQGLVAVGVGPKRTGLWFALPWLVGVISLTLAPMVASVLLSFTRWNGLSFADIRWVGADHYGQALRIDRGYQPQPSDPWYWAALGGRPADSQFYQALYNSAYYGVFAVPLGLAASLGLALLLNLPLRGIRFFRTLYYLPHVLGGVATVLIWSWLLNPKFGVINAALRWMYEGAGLVAAWYGADTSVWSTPDWLYSPAWCKPALILMHTWTAGGAMLIFLAALQGVSDQSHEAARIDGAGRWRRFRDITLPQITPAIFFNLILGIVTSLQTFSQAYLLYNRAQDDGLLFYVLYLYRCAFEAPYRIGYASALAWILFVILFGLTLLVVRSGRRWVYYEVE
jgi:multiple sugar transport system permease protein